MKAGSLCSGVGGLDLALEALGYDIAWQAESDPAASAVLAHHWPGVPNLGDISKTDWSKVEPVEALCAGYPCQDFSLAGQRKGMDGERGKVWGYVRDAIGVLRPRHVYLENVAGHLSLGFDVVLADLAEMGFDAEWGLVRASDVGAPHQRTRLFIVATNPDRDPVRQQPVAITGRSGTTLTRRPREDAADTIGIGRGAGPGLRSGHTTGNGRRLAGDDHRQDDAVEWGAYELAIRRWEAVNGPCPKPTDDKGRLNPDFTDWMQGFPPGWTAVDGVSKANRLKCAGNSVVQHQALYAYSHLCIGCIE